MISLPNAFHMRSLCSLLSMVGESRRRRSSGRRIECLLSPCFRDTWSCGAELECFCSQFVCESILMYESECAGAPRCAAIAYALLHSRDESSLERPTERTWKSYIASFFPSTGDPGHRTGMNMPSSVRVGLDKAPKSISSVYDLRVRMFVSRTQGVKISRYWIRGPRDERRNEFQRFMSIRSCWGRRAHMHLTMADVDFQCLGATKQRPSERKKRRSDT